MIQSSGGHFQSWLLTLRPIFNAAGVKTSPTGEDKTIITFKHTVTLVKGTKQLVMVKKSQQLEQQRPPPAKIYLFEDDDKFEILLKSTSIFHKQPLSNHHPNIQIENDIHGIVEKEDEKLNFNN